MQLNIKNPEARELAAELAKRTGESMSQAVTTAIRERLDRENRDKQRFYKRMGDIADELENLPALDPRSLYEIMDDMYDEDGLPK